MPQSLIVVDHLDDWAPYYPSEQVITFADYLSYTSRPNQRVRIINLCRDYSYLSEGYYCSLLSEARGHSVIPPSRVLSDMENPILYQLRFTELGPALRKVFKKHAVPEHLTFKSFFGQINEPSLKRLARVLFEQFPCPVLQFSLEKNGNWEISDLRMLSHAILTDDEQTEFANALDGFSRNLWRQQKEKKAFRYDLAMLLNPEESLPPSDKGAVNKFIKQGKALGVNVEIIGPSDYMRLAEFDALFIRETTSIDHHTYRFAKKAEAEGLVVIDDSKSIQLCTNKVFLADMFRTQKVPTPNTVLLRRGSEESVRAQIKDLGLPVIIKIPDGSFSRGMVRVENEDELMAKCAPLFEESSLLLAQAFLYTEFDWRIGILNYKPLYACRYYMVKNHWQIYRHDQEGNKSRTNSGGFETLPTFEVPKAVLEAAVKATRPIGDGFYGVDVKEADGKGYVIEVNDNPSIDSGVEDKYLGDQLYQLILQDFIRRIEGKRNG